MKFCCKCKKRVAIVFMQRMDANRKTKNEGYCLKCAKELGIAPISDFIDKMGIGEEEMEYLGDEMAGLLESTGLIASDDEDEEDDGLESRAPSIDLNTVFGQDSDGYGSRSHTQKGETDKKAKPQKRKNLETFCIDLTDRARNGKIDRVVGRERELDRVIQILCRRQKNNPCLIGEPGVGKTAVAESLALRIAAGTVPFKLKRCEIHLLDMASMVAGTQFRGQFENRMKGLLEEVKRLGNIILVIDEVHSIVSAGDAEGGMNAANILKPPLSRGEIQVIGATTLVEYRKFIEKDAALERRFQPIIIHEPSVSDTIEILRGIKGYYETFHGLVIPEETVIKTVQFSERYLTDRFLPDKAIDLLDESASYLALRDKTISKAQEARQALSEAIAERERLESAEAQGEEEVERYQRLADMKTRELKLEKEYLSLEAKRDKIMLLPEHLARVIEIWTGIPASSITENEFLRIDKLEERLKERIVGQDKAISSVARAIKRSRAGISAKLKPVSFIFAGPTGVGKTELVKTLGNDLFDSPEALFRLDMSEFMEKHSVSRIIGAPPGYIGYDEAGQLTEKVRRRPYCVVLFDEIEKAHPDVLNILLQILDDGRITDARGKEVNFCSAVIIMTTNAGSAGTMNSAGFSSNKGWISEDKIHKALNEFLRPEFLNRVDEIITFNQLTRQDFVHIARILLDDLKRALEQKGISFSYSPEAAALLAEQSFNLKYGARNLRRMIQTEVEDKAAELIIANYAKRISSLALSAQGSKLQVTGQ